MLIIKNTFNYYQMNRFAQKNVIITGGSEGIGYAVAVEFANANANLFLIARNLEKLQKAQSQLCVLTQGKVEVFSADVSDRQTIEQIIHLIGKQKGGIDILINNAGYGGGKRFDDFSVEELEDYMTVNYFGALYATRAAWGYLKASKGHLGFVSSVAGYAGLWGFTGYVPAKFALSGLAECLRMEGKDHGINVTIIFPPDTDTPLLHRSQAKAPPELVALMKSASLMTADAVAKLFVKGIADNRFEVICNGSSRLIRILKGIVPRFYFFIIDRILSNSRKKTDKLLNQPKP